MVFFRDESMGAPAARTGTPPTATAYMSDGTSSTSSSDSASTIPNDRAQASRSFTSYNTSIPRARTSLAAPFALRDGPHDFSETIKSDCAQPVLPQLRAELASGSHAISDSPNTDFRYEAVGGKKVMTAAAKERHSRIMKGEEIGNGYVKTGLI